MSGTPSNDRFVAQPNGSSRSDLDVRLVIEGQIATFEVAGGFARKPVPADGVIVETTTTTIFIPLAALVDVMGQGVERTEPADVAP
ncbi:MAG: hypothetical protein SGI86_01880 [Deltaproteobacteria bacterium]|nr:hypothetical protein [Deltaproteobacteria bacterium]